MTYRILHAGLLLSIGLMFVARADGASPTAVEKRFDSDVVMLLRKYCTECHGADNAEADLNLESFTRTSHVSEAYRRWKRVLVRLEEGEMPPADVDQPADAERQRAVQTLQDVFAHLAEVQAGDPGPVLLRRLTNDEYNHTIHDLTGVDLQPAREFPGEGAAGEGFTNTGQSLSLSAELLDKYVAAAERIASHALFLVDGNVEFFDQPANDRPDKAINLLAERIDRHYQRLHPHPADYYTAAWEFAHREELGSPLENLEQTAAQWQLSANYLKSIWMLLNLDSPTLILKTFQDAWRDVSVESIRKDRDDLADVRKRARAEFQAILMDGRNGVPGLIAGWQGLLCDNIGGPQDIDGGHKRTAQVKIPKPTDGTVQIHFVTTHVGNAAAKLYFGNLRFVSPDPKKKPHGPIQLYEWLARHAPQQLRSLPWDVRPPDQPLNKDRLVLATPATHTIVLPGEAASDLAGWTLQGEVEFVKGKRLVEGLDRTMAFCQGMLRTGELPTAMPSLWPGEPIVTEPAGSIQIRILASYGEFQKWYRARFAWKPTMPVGSGGVLRGSRTPSFVREYRHRFDPDNLLSRIQAQGHTNTDGFGNLRFLTAHRYDAPLRQLVLDPKQVREWDQLYRDLWIVGRVPRLSLDNFKHENRTNLITGLGSSNPNDGITVPDDKIEETIRRGFHIDFFGKDWQAASVDHMLAIYHWIRKDLKQWQHDYREIESAQVEGVVKFAQRAWRRPLTNDEAEALRAFYKQTASQPEMDRDVALRTCLVRILTAPDFLFRIEREPESDEASPVSDHELAVRLSYFLWASPPDDELRELADAGRLRDRQVLAEQTARMLQDARVRRFVEAFFGQMYQFANFDSFQGPDSERFPEFTPQLRAAMYEEPVRLFEKIVREDRPLDEILFPDYLIVNRLLAKHYGLEVPSHVTDDQTWWEHAAPGDRSGLLGMAAPLTRFSGPLRTSPIRRGDWISRSVLGIELPQPPMDVPELPAEEDTGDGLTLRERIARHAADNVCASCHAKFDGYGLALEGYDAIGRLRTTDSGGRSLDLRGSVKGSKPFEGFAGLRSVLGSRHDTFRRNVCEKLVGYALGREILLADERLVDNMMSTLGENHGRFSALVTTLVESEQFRKRRGADADKK